MEPKQKYARNLVPRFLSSVTGNEVGIFCMITQVNNDPRLEIKHLRYVE